MKFQLSRCAKRMDHIGHRTQPIQRIKAIHRLGGVGHANGHAVPRADAQLGQDRLFPFPHLGLHGAFVQMVVAQQVENGMDGEIADLPLHRVAKFLCLRLCL